MKTRTLLAIATLVMVSALFSASIVVEAGENSSGMLNLSELVDGTPTEDGSTPYQECIPPEQCCKICSKGKACGNSCISRAYRCHKGRGCACNASEVCRSGE